MFPVFSGPATGRTLGLTVRCQKPFAKAVENSSIVIPMTIKKSGGDWKISSVNVTNLFVAYDNEVKRQAVEFDKASKTV
ncbi:hypothetical protein [Megasphaera sueciensis]|jgi:hypothetical protein|uniref:hypothetical protein n=1 Tax=Megasphaera sueciensis TaxID=349094 RepID=UPI003D02F3B5